MAPPLPAGINCIVTRYVVLLCSPLLSHDSFLFKKKSSDTDSISVIINAAVSKHLNKNIYMHEFDREKDKPYNHPVANHPECIAGQGQESLWKQRESLNHLDKDCNREQTVRFASRYGTCICNVKIDVLLSGKYIWQTFSLQKKNLLIVQVCF